MGINLLLEPKKTSSDALPPALLPTYNSGSEGGLHLPLVEQVPVQLLEVGVPQDRALAALPGAAQPHRGVLCHELQNRKSCLFPPIRHGHGRGTH